MRNLFKLIVVGIFALVALTIFLNRGASNGYFRVFAQTANVTPTPPANANTNTNAATNTAKTNANVAASNKTIPDEFTLGKDSVSEYGEVAFNHKNHAFQNYSADGKSAVACVVCHHTDQPKSELKPPLVTSNRDAALTMAVFQASDGKVLSCRACHFQEGSVPEGKTMPKIADKEYNNELAYHINCNTCHDEAFKLRPELKKKAGFATTKDCNICHKTN